MSELPYYEGPGWAVVETELLRWGVVDCQLASQAAQYAGVTPIYALACIEFFKERRPAYRPSDLFRRLQQAAHYRDPDDPETWPKPKIHTTRRRRALCLS